MKPARHSLATAAAIAATVVTPVAIGQVTIETVAVADPGNTADGSLNMLAEGANIGFRVARPDSNPSDLDGDDDVGILDFLQMLAAWGPCPGCVEDTDNDGVVGIVDLLALLAAWGPT